MSFWKPNSFLMGFLTASVLGIAAFGVAGFRMTGGTGESSPSGKYHLDIVGPVAAELGGTYQITLRDRSKDQILRWIEVHLRDREPTRSLRDGSVVFRWNADETAVDVVIDGKTLIQVGIPPTAA